jgi:alkylhydroperoxidase/carboxymuconolactone decarboxylase family protein YurZ
MSRVEDTLRRLALNDEQTISLALDTGSLSLAASHLDTKTYALTRLAALLAIGAPAASCRWCAELAEGSGATEEEIVGVLWSIGPVVGLARVVAAAPALGLAIGYDVEAAFEEPAAED